LIEVEDAFSKAKMIGELETMLQVGDTVEPAVISNSVIILPFVNERDQDLVITKRISEELTTGLVNRGVSVVERRLLDKVLSELNLQQSGLFDPAKAQAIGKQIGAYAVVMGTVAPKNSYTEAQLRLVRVETGEILLAGAYIIRDVKLSTPLDATPTPPRIMWVHDRGSFRLSGGKEWTSRIDGRTFQFTEVVRTIAYIELRNGGGSIVRLYPDRCLLKSAKTADPELKEAYRGRWEKVKGTE